MKWGPPTAASPENGFERVSDTVGRIAVPLPFFGAPVNVYVFLAERPALIDTGPATNLARDLIEAGLATMDLGIGDLAHIFITHSHIDHSGFLHELVERSSATVFVQEDDFDATMDVMYAINSSLAAYQDVVIKWGFSADEALALSDSVRSLAQWGGFTPPARGRRLMGDQVSLSIPGANLLAIHTPGHTAGQAVLWDDHSNQLFSGDTVLAQLTPKPVVYAPPYRGRSNGLAHMLSSFESLRALPHDTLVLPGHGAPFRDLHGRIDAYLQRHQFRREVVLRNLEGRPRTIIDLTQSVWGKLATMDLAFAAREIHGHLEILEDERLVARVDDHGPLKFKLA